MKINSCCLSLVLEADGAVTPEPREETVGLSSGAETTLKLKVEPPQLQEDQTVSKEVSKELHAGETTALEENGGSEDVKEKGGEEEEEAAAASSLFSSQRDRR